MEYNSESNHSYKSTSSLDLLPSSQIRSSSTLAAKATNRHITQPKTKAQNRKLVLFAGLNALNTVLHESLGEAFLLYPSDCPTAEVFEYYPVIDDESPMLLVWADCRNLSDVPECIGWKDVPICEPFALGVLRNDIFLQAIIESPSSFEFTALTQTINEIFHSTPSTCSQVPLSRTIALVGLEKDCVSYQKKIRNSADPSRSIIDLIDSAVSYVLFNLDVEVVRFKKASEFCEYVSTLGRLVSARVTEGTQFVSEIDCVAKAQKEKPPEGISGQKLEDFELRQTWSAMLQMVPGVSKDRAQALLKHPECTCPRKLFRMFHHSNPNNGNSSSSNSSSDTGNTTRNMNAEILPPAKRALLLQNHFGASKTGKVTNQAKLSRHIYNLFSELEPNTLINN